MPERASEPAGSLAARAHPILLTAAVAYAVMAQGAFYPAQAVTLAALSALAALTSGGRLPKLVWASFAVLAAGIAASMALVPSGDPRVAISILTVAASASVIGEALARTRSFESLAATLAGIGALAAVLGLIGAAWHLEPLALEAQGIWRAASTLTYANSLGAVLVPCLAASAWLLARKPSLLLRLATAAAVAGLIASISRAAVVALAAGMLVAALSDRGELLAILKRARNPLLAGGIAGAAAMPSIFGEPQPLIAVTGMLIAAAVCLPDPGTKPGRMMAAIAGIALILGGAATTVGGSVDGLGERLVNEDRLRIWEVSLDTGREALPEGQGLSRFEVYEERHGKLFLIRYAHNELIQVLVEAGWAGLVSKLIAIGLLGWLLLQRRRGNAIALGVAAAFLVHGLLDFVWHVAAYVLFAFLFVGSVFAPVEPDQVTAGEEPSALEPEAT